MPDLAENLLSKLPRYHASCTSESGMDSGDTGPWVSYRDVADLVASLTGVINCRGCREPDGRICQKLDTDGHCCRKPWAAAEEG